MINRQLPTLFMLLIAFLFSMTLSSSPQDSLWSSRYSSGDICLDVFGAESHQEFAMLRLNASYLLHKTYLPGGIPIDIGLGLNTMLGTLNRDSIKIEALGVGAGISAHIGFRGVGGHFERLLDRLDVFLETGPGYTHLFTENNTETWNTINNVPLLLHSRLGIHYYLSPNFAISTAYANWGRRNSLSLGIRLKTGGSREEPHPGHQDSITLHPDSQRTQPAAPPVILHRENLSRTEALVFIKLFQDLYWSVFAHSGMYIDDYNFIDQEGIVFQITLQDPLTSTRQQMKIGKSLLFRDLHRSRWGFDLIISSDDTIRYEATLNYRGHMEALTIIENDRAYDYEPDFPLEWRTAILLGPDDFQSFSRERVRMETASGHIICDLLVYDAGRYRYRWWVSRDVPGYLVKFEVHDNETEIMKGEMTAITINNRTRLPY